jgi:AcrR family transcriptional regulator/ketosteroid isomerase-like protein
MMSERLRADASLNRTRILETARKLFVERGANVPFDEIAKQAGVGSATLYRRFPDRASLQRAVAHDVLQQAMDAALSASANEPDPFAALARYMHEALDLGVSAVMPVLFTEIGDDAVLAATREASALCVQELIDAARLSGQIRADLDFADIGPLLVRLSRPLPGPIPPEVDLQLAHRHLDLALIGMRSEGGGVGTTVSGPSLSLVALRDFQIRERELIMKTETATADVLATVQAWANAEEAMDTPAVGDLLDEQFMAIGPRGFVLNRQQWLDRYPSGDLKQQRFEVSEASVRVFGDTAIVLAKQSQQTTYKDEDASGVFSITLILVSTGSGWRLAGEHLSPAPPPMPG